MTSVWINCWIRLDLEYDNIEIGNGYVNKFADFGHHIAIGQKDSERKHVPNAVQRFGQLFADIFRQILQIVW